MDEQTEIIAKAAEPASVPLVEPKPESHIMSVSVRAWIVLMIVGTLCIITILNPILSYFATGDIIIELKEPFYSAVGMSVGYYFGQSGQKK